MKSDITIIGGGASGLMAAYSAARTAVDAGKDFNVLVLEKMPRPGRKIMITGKGRCNFTNVKEWNDFSSHIRSNSSFVKNAFHALSPAKVLEFFSCFGMDAVVERGDRAFPASYHASDVVDTLVNACKSLGVKVITDAEVKEVSAGQPFRLTMADGSTVVTQRLVVATGGLSYPSTGSTGDGYRWAAAGGHRIEQLFPALTALVPNGYKQSLNPLKGHIDRSEPLSELGRALCGVRLKNVSASLEIDGNVSDTEFGDIDFTDGGIEGPIGFQLSRKAVKVMVNGSKTVLHIDLKAGVDPTELTARIRDLWQQIDKDPRSRELREKEKCRILLGKLMPRELIPGFTAMHPGIIAPGRRISLVSIANALKDWRFEIAGYVGYERAVITAGGVCVDDILPKTMESRLVKGLYFCGEVLDIDCDTGGYNLQLAFSTGAMAGTGAVRSLL